MITYCTVVFISYMLSCCTSLAIPKSVTLQVSFSPTNTLRAARSRWIICSERYRKAKCLIWDSMHNYNAYTFSVHPYDKSWNSQCSNWFETAFLYTGKRGWLILMSNLTLASASIAVKCRTGKKGVKSEVMTRRGSTKGVLDSRVNWRQPVN